MNHSAPSPDKVDFAEPNSSTSCPIQSGITPLSLCSLALATLHRSTVPKQRMVPFVDYFGQGQRLARLRGWSFRPYRLLGTKPDTQARARYDGSPP